MSEAKKPKRPDLEFSTSVKAEQLEFGKVPEKKVRYEGDPGHDTQVEVERENIPEDPEEGVTYRGVRVDWTVAQRIVHPTDAADATGDEEE